MSKLEQIEAFLTIIQENSFAAAARKQGISTAAISRQISRLEADLGVQLLERTTRQIALTEVGAQYYQYAKRALNELTDAQALIQGSQIEPSGSLKMTSNRYFANKYLIPHLAEFIKRYPKLILNLELAERFPDFNEENIDILFGVSLEGPPDLVRKRIMTTRYVLCASKGYLKKFGTPSSPEELSQHCYITHSMRKPDIIQFRHEKKICVKPMLYLNDCQVMLECALRGIGIVMLHDYIVRDVIHQGLLIEILSEYQEPEKPVYLYYQHQRYLQPKIRHCIDFFTQKIQSTY
jgi:DNA-binding transcriptional LysR family regulator